MARIPVWLGNTMEVVFSGMIHPVEVCEVRELDRHLRCIAMRGDFQKVKFTPGNVIEFRITKTEFRHYTLSGFNVASDTCEMLIYLHGKGIGSEWAENLSAGDRLKLIGPGGKIRYNSRHSRHVCFGDETSLGLFRCMKTAADEAQHAFHGIAELDDDHRHWPGLAGVDVRMVAKSETASEAVAALEEPQFAFVSSGLADTTYYLTGRAKSIQAMRKALVAKGVPMKHIQTDPYWAEGKSGL